jgi:hypothetical protein
MPTASADDHGLGGANHHPSASLRISSLGSHLVCMIRIAISEAAFDAIAKTLTLGSVG